MKQKYQYYTLVCSTKFFEQVKMRYINKKLCSLTQWVRKEAGQNYNIQSLKFRIEINNGQSIPKQAITYDNQMENIHF